MVATSLLSPLAAALAVEPLGMYILDMHIEDLAPPIAPIVSLMDCFLARRQWDQSCRYGHLPSPTSNQPSSSIGMLPGV
ncbi:hypothetical protein RJT34_12807 [Clitoria ternatea]|uniref:Uncharacterized protein n=1 Tax=Clitoria ternatea TaxID=43366 RepID=A0AAN9JMH8_CLITE